MPSFSSASPPISTRLVDDPRPLPGAQAPLTTAPLTYKAAPVLIPPKTPPATRADSVPPPAGKECVGENFALLPCSSHPTVACSRARRHPSSGSGAIPLMGPSTEKCSTKYLSSMKTTRNSRKAWWTHTLSRQTKRSRRWILPCVHSLPLCLLLPSDVLIGF